MNQSHVRIAVAIFTGLLYAPGRANAEPQNEEPIPSSAYEIEDTFDRGFTQAVEPDTKLSELLQSSEVALKLRNFYCDRDKPRDATDPRAWAQGGILSHKMGRVGGIFSMTTELMGSFPLDAPDDHGGTGLLDKHQNEITTIGVLNPRLTYAGQVLSLYRQRYNLPYVNEQDSRMLPHTFEGYTIAQPIATSKEFQYIAGYIQNMKKRDSENFNSMSDAAGVNQIERGMLLAGARAYFTPEWSLAAIDYYVSDVLNILYSDSIYKLKLDPDVEQTFSVQYSNQSSVGDDLLREQEYSTGFWGLQSATSYAGFVLKLAATLNNSGADIQSPYGVYPGYNSSIVQDFNKAGEKAWQIALSYDLANAGLDGFKVSTGFVQGNEAIDEDTGVDLGDEREADVTLDYRFGEGVMKGLWVRLRSASIHDDDAGDTQDFRIIINYELALVTPEKPV